MLCETFLTLSEGVWSTLFDGRSLLHQFGEETITDMILFNLKKKNADEITIQGFDKIEEGKNGADWEWWFTDKTGRWIGMRVQAKIINIKSNRFEHLHYRKDKKSLYQCEKLIIEATGNLPKLSPFYCFYSHYVDGILKSDNTYGCSLLSAYDVRKIRANKTDRFVDLFPNLIPWHNLVCHSKTIELVDHVRGFLSANVGEGQITSEILYQPPVYVQSLFTNGDLPRNEIETPNIAGVVIFKEAE